MKYLRAIKIIEEGTEKNVNVVKKRKRPMNLTRNLINKSYINKILN